MGKQNVQAEKVYSNIIDVEAFLAELLKRKLSRGISLYTQFNGQQLPLSSAFNFFLMPITKAAI